MRKRITIKLEESVYDELYRLVGKQHIDQFIENSLLLHVVDSTLDDGYQAMAADRERETEAIEWTNGRLGDSNDVAR